MTSPPPPRLRMPPRAGQAAEFTLRVGDLEPDTPVAIDEFRRDDWMTSGMGLWVARRLLDQLGGRLEQPMQVPWGAGARPPMTEDVMDDPSQPLLQDATWRIVLPRA